MIFLLLAFVAYLGYVVHVTQVLEPSLKSDSFKNCEPLLKSRGPEDFEIIEDKFLIVSSGYHKPFYKKGIHPGKLIVFDLENGKEKKYRFEFEFNPHGLHSRKIAPHTYLIAAINHTSKGDRVEFFEFNSQDEGLEYKRSVANEEFYHLNDIVLLGENKFLVTQDRYFDNQVGSLFEAFARLAMGRILYFNEDQLDVVATGLRYPNGITKVNEQFVVASMTDKKLLFYNWEKEKLNLSEEIFVNGFPDNVTYNKQSNK